MELGLILYHDAATCCLGMNEEGVMRYCGDGMDLNTIPYRCKVQGSHSKNNTHTFIKYLSPSVVAIILQSLSFLWTDCQVSTVSIKINSSYPRAMLICAAMVALP
jgi:hypothetical protein